MIDPYEIAIKPEWGPEEDAELDRILRPQRASREGGKLGAIPTVFGDQLYRSQLEARAALWLASHDVTFEYEPWRGKSGYLPDFVLLDQKVIFECKGVMTTDDKETLQRAALDASEAGWQLFTWMGYTWQRIRSGDAFRQHGRFDSGAFLCGNCLRWTWRHKCDTCGSEGGYLAEHLGRSDEVRIPGRQMSTLYCELGRKDGLSYEVIDSIDPAIRQPEGFDQGEHEQITKLTTEIGTCRYFTPDREDYTPDDTSGV